jgi:hypothetical protein
VSRLKEGEEAESEEDEEAVVKEKRNKTSKL